MTSASFPVSAEPCSSPTARFRWTKRPPAWWPASASKRSSGSRPRGAAGRSGARRIGDHRGETGLGGQLPVDRSPAAKLADRRPLLDELDVELEQAAGLYRVAALRPFDRHEIDQL